MPAAFGLITAKMVKELCRRCTSSTDQLMVLTTISRRRPNQSTNCCSRTRLLDGNALPEMQWLLHQPVAASQREILDREMAAMPTISWASGTSLQTGARRAIYSVWSGGHRSLTVTLLGHDAEQSCLDTRPGWAETSSIHLGCQYEGRPSSRSHLWASHGKKCGKIAQCLAIEAEAFVTGWSEPGRRARSKSSMLSMTLRA